MIQSSKDALVVAAALGGMFFLYFALPLLFVKKFWAAGKSLGKRHDKSASIDLAANSSGVQIPTKKVFALILAVIQVLCCIYFYNAGNPETVVTFLFAINIELSFLFLAGVPASIMLLLVALKWYWIGYFISRMVPGTKGTG